MLYVALNPNKVILKLSCEIMKSFLIPIILILAICGAGCGGNSTDPLMEEITSPDENNNTNDPDQLLEPGNEEDNYQLPDANPAPGTITTPDAVSTSDDDVPLQGLSPIKTQSIDPMSTPSWPPAISADDFILQDYVYTLIGSIGGEGNRDGVGPYASFYMPHRMAVSKDGFTMHVADTYNDAVRRIDLLTNEVSTFAAQFSEPMDLCVSPDETTLYAIDQSGAALQKVDLATGIATIIPASLIRASGIACHPNQDVAYVADDSVIYKIDLSTNDITQLSGAFNDLRDIDINYEGTKLFVSEHVGGDIYQIDLGGEGNAITLLTTSDTLPDFPAISYLKSADGNEYLFAVTHDSEIKRISLSTNEETIIARNDAGLNKPFGLAAHDRILYVADTFNSAIRKITLDEPHEILPVAGNIASSGMVDGALADARFNGPAGIALIGDNIYIADSRNHAIRILKINADGSGAVSTLAGGIKGFMDSSDGAPQFAYFTHLATDGSSLYVADTGNKAIRKVELNPDGSLKNVSTVAKDGFSFPAGIVAVGGFLYVSDKFDHAIKKIDLSTNAVTIIVSTGLDQPESLAINGNDLYVADNLGNRISKITLTPPYNIETLAGGDDIRGVGALYFYGGMLYFTEKTGQTLRQLNPATGGVSAIAGRPSIRGTFDAPLLEAGFNNPNGLAFVPAFGRFIISDTGSHSIRSIGVGGIINYDDYCGDEPVFAGEEQAAVNVTVENSVGHNLLPPINVNIIGNIDASTVAQKAVHFKINDVDAVYSLEIVKNSSDTRLTFKNGVNGVKAWAPSATYKVKLCHQIKTNDGKPIKPIEVTITTHAPNQQENIGIYHSNNTRSGVFYLPKNYNPALEYPLAVLLHGLGGNGSGMVSEFQSLSDAKNIILLGPDGFSRKNPFGSNNIYYFNPNYKNTKPEDYTFIMSTLNKMLEAFPVDDNQILVAGMSMGAPATLFMGTHATNFTHAAMLHGVRWNYDEGNKNDVPNVLWYPWELTPIGAHKPPFWYSTSTDDWVTNYDSIPFPMTVESDLNYLLDAGLDVTHKFCYTGGHTMGVTEKQEMINWFLYEADPASCP